MILWMKAVGGKYVLVLGVAAAAALFLFGVCVPQMRKTAALQKAVTSLRKDVDARTARLQTTIARYAETRRTQRKLALFEEAVPREDRIGQFLESLDGIARRCGLSSKNVVPSAVLESGELSCLPIEINLRGGFEAVYEFLRRVESLPRVARVRRLELASAEDAPHELVSSVTVHVYFRPS